MSREGGCACGAVRYRLTSEPLFVHCCHCLNCHRQTGSAFVINLLIEADRVIVDGAPPPGPPDVHIFTRSKRPWGEPRGDTPAVDVYYDPKTLWPAESLERRDAVV